MNGIIVGDTSSAFTLAVNGLMDGDSSSAFALAVNGGVAAPHLFWCCLVLVYLRCLDRAQTKAFYTVAQ